MRYELVEADLATVVPVESGEQSEILLVSETDSEPLDTHTELFSAQRVVSVSVGYVETPEKFAIQYKKRNLNIT